MSKRKTGRNERCPCGSGRKYKVCCLREDQARRSTGAGYTAADRGGALEKIMRRLGSEKWRPVVEERQRFFWDGLEDASAPQERLEKMGLNELCMHAFIGWLLFDPSGRDECCIAERMLPELSALSPAERRWVEQMIDTSLRLYEIRDLVPGASITLEDLALGKMVTVRERSASRFLRRWDILAARINPRGASGEPEIDGLLTFPRHAARSLVDEVLDELSDWPGPKGSDETVNAFFKEYAPCIHDAFLEAALKPAIPSIVMPDGEEALLTTVRFEVRDRDALTAALDGARDIHRVDGDRSDDEWHWMPRKKGEREQPPVTVRIDGGVLFLQALTRGAGQRAKKRIERLAKDAAKALELVTHEDPVAAIQSGMFSAGERVERPPLDESPELDDLVLEHYERHYNSWIDEPVPALDGETPREAARSSSLRPRVVELLKDLEQQYERGLSMNKASYDPTWMWDDLELTDLSEAPRRRDHPPPLAHEVMARLVPGFQDLARQVATRVREATGGSLTAAIRPEDLSNDLSVTRFLGEQAMAAVADGLTESDAVVEANYLCEHLHYMSSLELHRRKVFWISEGLAWMLGSTNLDISGDALHLPFSSFALVFTDRDTLRAAERLLSTIPERECSRHGRKLDVMCVYVTETQLEEKRGIRFTFTFDDRSAQWPYMIARDLLVAPGAKLEDILESHFPDVCPEKRDPLFTSPFLHELLKRSLNAILYATSAKAEVEGRQPPSCGEERGKASLHAVPLASGEEVFYLPGHIDVQEVRRLQRLERAPGGRALVHRFLVRGHWRRAAATWRDQRSRWVKPYWKGPDMATVIERAYRLKEPREASSMAESPK